MTARQRSGPSVARVAEGIADRLDEPLRNGELWHFTLSCRRPERCWLVASFRGFRDYVSERDERVGLLGAPDVGANGHYHAHVVAQLPADRTPHKMITWWLRVTDAARVAQHRRRIRDRADLVRVLEHNLQAAGRLTETNSLAERVAMVGALGDRVQASGPLDLVWRSAANVLAVPGVEAPFADDADDHQASRERLPVPRRGHVCRWCLSRMTPGTSATWCPDKACKRMASNALAREAKDVAFDLRKYVARKEALGWSRPEALRAARCELLGVAGAADPWSSKRDRFARCRALGCGALLGTRIGAATCGAAACRQRLHRRKASSARLEFEDERVQRLDAAGHRRVALRLSQMITNGTWSYSARLIERSLPLAKELSYEPRSFAELYRRAKVRPMTPVDEAETIAAWIMLGIEVSIARDALRFYLSIASHQTFDRATAQDLARRRVLCTLGRQMRLQREWAALDQPTLDAWWARSRVSPPA